MRSSSSPRTLRPTTLSQPPWRRRSTPPRTAPRSTTPTTAATPETSQPRVGLPCRPSSQRCLRWSGGPSTTQAGVAPTRPTAVSTPSPTATSGTTASTRTATGGTVGATASARTATAATPSAGSPTTPTATRGTSAPTATSATPNTGRPTTTGSTTCPLRSASRRSTRWSQGCCSSMAVCKRSQQLLRRVLQVPPDLLQGRHPSACRADRPAAALAEDTCMDDYVVFVSSFFITSMFSVSF
mmetsp:Transcript_117070/g.377784  ORF Transcript_117070/g.377784 Transcript_117070/m.377784 type:complete len:241 (+) Transcript_117070:176-898(+)